MLEAPAWGEHVNMRCTGPHPLAESRGSGRAFRAALKHTLSGNIADTLCWNILNLMVWFSFFLLYLCIGWDSDLSSIILLLHLIPPSAQGRKRPGKVSATQAEKHLVVFMKVCIVGYRNVKRCLFYFF